MRDHSAEASGEKLCRASAGRFDARATRFGKPDGNGLLRRLLAVFALADMMHFFANKFALSAG